MPIDTQALASAVHRAESVCISTHLNPDGDALGSEVAFARALTYAGKKVRIINHSPTPSQYLFLSELFPIEVWQPALAHDIERSDAIIILDANQLARLGSLEESVRRSSATKVCLDHHPYPEDFAHLRLIDESAAATAQLVLQAIQALWPAALDHQTASALYVAIMTDTGSFRFPKTDAALFRSVAALVDAGADPVELADRVYNSGSPQRLQLLGLILQSLATAHDGRVASLTVSRQMFDQTGTDESDTENVINHALAIDGVQIALMFSEIPGWIKISLRSKGSIPVNALAREFGGNGHTNAAGARVAGGSLNDIIGRVTERAGHYVEPKGVS